MRFSSVESCFGPDFDGYRDRVSCCRCQLAEKRDRDLAMVPGHGVVLDRTNRGRGGSRVDSLLANARGHLSGAHCTSGRPHRDTIDEEKNMGDDPAAVYRDGRVGSGAKHRGCVQTEYPQRAWGKLGQFYRERVHNKFIAWRDHVVGGRRTSMDGLGSGVEPGSVGGRLTFGGTPECAPLLGATGTGPVKRTATARIPEASGHSRVSRSTGSRPMSASAWLVGPMSTSTPKQHRRSSGRLVKRRPRSIATTGQRDKVTMSSFA